jgi:hypothetical protein
MYCLFCVVLFIVCVYMCTELLPPGGYPTAVNKYIISYHKHSSKSFKNGMEKIVLRSYGFAISVAKYE